MKIGDKFNDWTVIDDKSINRNGATMYLCIAVANKHANQQPSQPLTKLEGSETN